MTTYQVSYEQDGKEWLADINLFQDAINVELLLLMECARLYGKVSNVTIVEQYL